MWQRLSTCVNTMWVPLEFTTNLHAKKTDEHKTIVSYYDETNNSSQYRMGKL